MESASSYGLASVYLYKKGEKSKAYEYIDLAIEIAKEEKYNFCIQKANFLENDGHIEEELKYYKTKPEKGTINKDIKNKIKRLEKDKTC